MPKNTLLQKANLLKDIREYKEKCGSALYLCYPEDLAHIEELERSAKRMTRVARKIRRKNRNG